MQNKHKKTLKAKEKAELLRSSGPRNNSVVRSLSFLSVAYRSRLRIEAVVNLKMPKSIEKNIPTKSSPAKGPGKGQPNKM